MRLFFALWPDGRTRALMADAASVLRLPARARPVSADSYHLTLAFVGEVTEPELAVLQGIGRDQHAAACTLDLEAVDYWAEPQVVVMLPSVTPPALIELSARLHQDLALHDLVRNRGCPLPPAAPLRAHVTLARKVTQAPVLQAMSPISWRARSFSLVRSDTSGRHSVYTVVDAWPLLDEAPTASKSL